MADRNENRGEGIVIHLTEKQMEIAKDIVSLSEEQFRILEKYVAAIKKGENINCSELMK